MNSGRHRNLSATPQREPGQYAVPAARKPVLLSIATGWSALIGCLYVYSGINGLVSAKDSLVAYIAGASIGDMTSNQLASLAADPEVAAAVDDRYGIIATKAVSVLIAGVTIVLLTWLARHAATWARALVLVATFVAMVPVVVLLAENTGLAVNKVLPTGTWIAAFCSVPLSFAVYVLFFLPPINRYARALRAAR
ncbi:hypothetical protein [Nonomuraea angiospora]|uniref:hypothetical protein n=1 Tax=Nonomuraea angiospora TaxID=46172 RepID=UPI0029AAD5C5|nr:hypothetical protein [Nonomuraea angiospora]MDX3101506.1 hypothetical protein [Nonomuraea angiospora]